MNQKPQPGFVSSRRRFLTTFALGAGVSPLLSLGRSAFARSDATQAPSLCYSNKRVLSSGDLKYLGAMRCPDKGPRMDFSYGSMTGRRVNGQVQLLMVGNVTIGSPVYEFADTGGYSLDPLTAPLMPLVRAWGDIYGGKKTTWDAQGNVRTPARWEAGGYYWHEGNQLLYWTYYQSYNTSHFEDWSLGASRLNADGTSTAFGPWRTAGTGPGAGLKGPWHNTRVSMAPSGEMICGATLSSGNSASPWGPDLWAGNWPTTTTPAGFGAPDIPIQKYLTYYFFAPNIANNGTWTGPIRSARRPGDYFFENFPTGGHVEIDPLKNGGVGSWTDVDIIRACTWIDLPDVAGVLFTGMLGAEHIWYATASNNFTCAHGVPSPMQITGPVMTNGYPVMYIYDPNDLNAVRAGTKTDYTVEPSEIVNAQTRWGLKTNPTGVGTAKLIAGTYFDAPSRKLYIAAPDAEPKQGYGLPLVHVFQIA